MKTTRNDNNDKNIIKVTQGDQNADNRSLEKGSHTQIRLLGKVIFILIIRQKCHQPIRVINSAQFKICNSVFDSGARSSTRLTSFSHPEQHSRLQQRGTGSERGQKTMFSSVVVATRRRTFSTFSTFATFATFAKVARRTIATRRRTILHKFLEHSAVFETHLFIN